jgi:hypothetical protein
MSSFSSFEALQQPSAGCPDYEVTVKSAFVRASTVDYQFRQTAAALIKTVGKLADLSVDNVEW